MVVSKLAAPRNETPSDNTQFYVIILGRFEPFIGQSRKRGRREIMCATLFDSTEMTSKSGALAIYARGHRLIINDSIVALKTLKCLLRGMFFYAWPCKL